MNRPKHAELLATGAVVFATIVLIVVRTGTRARKHSLERQLFAALDRDDADTVIALLDRGVTLRPNVQHPTTIISAACNARAKRTLVALLRRGEHPGANDVGIPAMHNDVEMVDTLIRAGASPNAIVNGRFPVMISLAEKRQLGMMKRLADYGADLNVVSFATGTRPYGSTPLMTAVWLKDTDSTRMLLSAKAQVDKKLHDARSDLDGYTALMIAEQINSVDEASLLLESGAKTDTVAADGTTPIALAQKNDAMLRLIQKYSGIKKK